MPVANAYEDQDVPSTTARTEQRIPCRRECTLYFHAFLQGLHQSVVYPSLAYSVDEVMHTNATLSGATFFVFLFFGLLGNIKLGALVRAYTPRDLLLTAYVFRIFSGLVILPLSWSVSIFGDNWGVALVLFMRMIYGCTLFTAPLALSYLGVHSTTGNRPFKIANFTMSLSFGLVCGPPLGTLLLAMNPMDFLMGTGLTGGVTACTSLLAVLVIFFCFDDTSMLTQNAGSPKAMHQLTVKFLSISSLCAGFGFAGVVALEAMLGLVLAHEFAIPPSQTWPVWLLQGITQVMSSELFKRLYQVFGVKGAAIIFGALSLVFGATIINWNDMTQRIPFWWFCISLFFKITGMFAAMNLLHSHVSQRMPGHLQAVASATIMSASMIGRGIGPVLSGFAFDLGKNIQPGTYLCDNLAFLMQYLYICMSCVVILVFWNFITSTVVFDA